jgi:AcrR family transcriptional regulator
MSNEDLKERFFEAAQEILATDGYGGLKLAAVCKSLRVTTGAFYHAFGSWNEFTGEFLDNWRRERTTLLIELARAAGDPVVQLEMLRQATVELRHGGEAAIRVWAAVDPTVAGVQMQVDQERCGAGRYATPGREEGSTCVRGLGTERPDWLRNVDR